MRGGTGHRGNAVFRTATPEHEKKVGGSNQSEMRATLEHDPEKKKPVFRNNHASPKSQSANRF
jgi:hypothetical protein